jgi:hypothetical protein
VSFRLCLRTSFGSLYFQLNINNIPNNNKKKLTRKSNFGVITNWRYSELKGKNTQEGTEFDCEKAKPVNP